MRNRFFRIFILLIAIIVAGAAAYFSVFGISKLFAGAKMAAIIMASSLEIGKLVTVSYLYRVWSIISKMRRIVGIFFVSILMLITSVGIYGFLSNAFEQTSIKVEQQDSQVGIIDTRIESKNSEKNRYENLIIDKQNRINTLTELRKQQEVRLDSLLVHEHWVNARRTTEIINNADEEIKNTYSEIDGLGVMLDSVNQDIVSLKTQKLSHQQDNNVSAEIGPLKYLSRLLNKSMDKIVNWVILLIIFTFDPLAVYLVLSYNQLVLESVKNRKKREYLSEGKYIDEDEKKEDEDLHESYNNNEEQNKIKRSLKEKYNIFKNKDKKEVGIKEEIIQNKNKVRKSKMTNDGGIKYYYEED